MITVAVYPGGLLSFATQSYRVGKHRPFLKCTKNKYIMSGSFLRSRRPFQNENILTLSLASLLGHSQWAWALMQPTQAMLRDLS
jgi:hypothetical protein